LRRAGWVERFDVVVRHRRDGLTHARIPTATTM
jgi:hypothetical protein